MTSRMRALGDLGGRALADAKTADEILDSIATYCNGINGSRR
jgi:hypothetical protein